jgi:hypothetical protein
VQQQEVNLVDAELADALVEAAERLVVAVVANPEFRLDEDLERLTPDWRMPSPTSRSLKYAAAVSIRR